MLIKHKNANSLTYSFLLVNPVWLATHCFVLATFPFSSPPLSFIGYGACRPGEELDEVMVPSDKVGKVIGRGGEKINWLQSESGARLQMIQDDPSAPEKPLRIQGTRQSIDHAKKLVLDLIAPPEPRAPKPQDDEELYPTVGGLSSGDVVTNLAAYRTQSIEVGDMVHLCVRVYSVVSRGRTRLCCILSPISYSSTDMSRSFFFFFFFFSGFARLVWWLVGCHRFGCLALLLGE